jgi:hypothetical protein
VDTTDSEGEEAMEEDMKSFEGRLELAGDVPSSEASMSSRDGSAESFERGVFRQAYETSYPPPPSAATRYT